jgi:hypothetical protein
MSKFIESIVSKLPFGDSKIEIFLRGNNLIITGRNGSGKTTLLRAIHKKLEMMAIGDAFYDVERWIAMREGYVEKLHKLQESDPEYQRTLDHIKVCNRNIDPYVQDPQISLVGPSEFSKRFRAGHAGVPFFDAHRQANILSVKSASGTVYDPAELLKRDVNVGEQFEGHLVNLATRRALALTSKKPDHSVAANIDKWFDNLERNLKFLFEDSELELIFDPDRFKYYIQLPGRDRFTLQNLSSGYSAVLSILSSLLMRAAYVNLPPSSISGAVLIDEIDAHLHVSLQRKIFPFLSELFPEVQFIVTTHSPFVLTSVNDAVIFDISSREHINDLSAYSYEAVVEGVLGVGQSSILLEKKIRDAVQLLEDNNADSASLQRLVDELLPNKDELDEQSKYYLNKILFELNKRGGTSV